MKVVFYTRAGYLDSALPLVGAMAEEHEVHLVVEVSPEGRTSPVGALPLDAAPGLRRSDLSWLPAPMAKRMESLASCHLASFPHPRAFHPSNLLTCRAVARLVRSVRPAVLHFDDATTRGFTVLYLVRRVAVALSIHDSHQRVGERKGRFELVRKRFLARAKLVVFRSRYAHDTFTALTTPPRGALVRVVPLGVFDIFSELCAGDGGDGPPTVLFFGRLAPYKGVEVLALAAPLVARRVPRVRFVLAGNPVEGYEPGEAPDLPAGAAWEAGGGHVAPEQLCRLFREASVVALPYLEATQSGVVSTAFAFAKPVVASAVGGLPEMVEDGVTGRLVPPGDAAALADALVDLLEDPGGRAALAARISERAGGDLSAGAIARAAVTAYREVARQSR